MSAHAAAASDRARARHEEAVTTHLLLTLAQPYVSDSDPLIRAFSLHHTSSYRRTLAQYPRNSNAL